MAGFETADPPMNDGLMKPPPGTNQQSEHLNVMAQPVERKNGAEGEIEGELLTDKEWVLMFKEALRVSSDFQQTKLRPAWQRNYRAFGNRHVDGSKYDTPRYRNRSRLFKPKTRMAVRKNDASAASAMFSTSDVVQIKAENESDHEQVMTARFISAALNYRLDRSGRMTGPHWFMTSMGARQDAQIMGVCLSKQYWRFEERVDEFVSSKPRMDLMTGTAMMDDAGQPLYDDKIEKNRKVIEDRPMIDLIPGEHGFVDPTADWRDPIQSSGYFFCAYPVRLNDLETMVKQNAARPRLGGGRWRNVNVRELTKGRTSAETRRNDAVRRSREGGQDRYESRFADRKGDVIWLYDCYYRYNGEDWNFWMLGETMILSDPLPTRHAYPEQDGDRPYVMGVGALETHKTHPMSPVESWQPLQMEANEITNLGLDSLKMSISPITKIVRGRNIDFKQVQARGPDAMVMVEKPEDVTFEQAPGPHGAEQAYLNNLNVDFDELSGTFSTGSVQSNRQLNETVGGMNIISGSANALTEFDLRIWGETWAEPTIRQVVRLIQFYESSEHVIQIAGKKAGLIMAPQQPPAPPGPLEEQPDPENPPIDLPTALDLLGDAKVSVRCNIGIGSMDAQQKLQKFGMGLKMTMDLGALLSKQGIEPNAAEIMNEVWGMLGYKDGARFFVEKEGEDPPPPEVQKIMMEMELAKAKGQLEQAKLQAQVLADREEHRLEMQKMQAEITAEREQTRMQLQAIQAKLGLEVQGQRIKQQGQLEDQRIKQRGLVIDQQIRREGMVEDQRAQREQSQATHEQSLKQSAAMSEQKVKSMKAQAAAKPKPAAGKPKPKGKGK